MFQTFESVRRVSIASVLRSWSSSGLTGTERAFDAFTSLDGGKVNNTCALFPLNRKIGAGRQDKLESNEKIYDPIFIMALLGATLVEKDLTGLEWVEIMRCGGLGIVVCALSARDKSIREYANWLLAKTFSIISVRSLSLNHADHELTVQGTSFHERDQLLYTLRLIRHAISSPEQSNSFPRIPPMISLFLSYVIRAQATPSHFWYPITSRFLLQRPVFDTTDVPALYSMLYASEEGWKNERAWIVRLLRDGMKSETDWRVTKRRHTWSLLATLFQSSLDIPFRRLILQVSPLPYQVHARNRKS
jgi:nucleolar pre-ribosomal-associated protein 1